MRTTTLDLYAEETALDAVTAALALTPVERGENVVVTIPNDPGIFSHAQSPTPGIACTSDLQTYLDLTQAGERGIEAAEHLRRERLSWTT